MTQEPPARQVTLNNDVVVPATAVWVLVALVAVLVVMGIVSLATRTGRS